MIKLRLENIHLNYKNISALSGINLNLKRGEIHAIVGEHGAGKSSLAHIIAGLKTPAQGNVIFYKKNHTRLSYQRVIKSGIRIVTQHNPLHENMTVADNILLDHNSGLFPILTRKKSHLKAQAYIESMGFNLSARTMLQDLRLADRALVDILRHLLHDPELLILDETLEKLASEDLHKIIKILKARVNQGLTVLFISHRVDDIYNVADRVTIIRDGKALLTKKIDNIDKINLIKLAYTHTLHSNEIESRESFNQILRYNEAILNDLPVVLFVVDNNGVLRMLNKSSKEILGRKSIGKHLLSIIPESSPDFLEIMKASIGNKQIKTYYRIPLDVNKSEKYFNITTYPTYERSTLMGNIIILVDITEEEKLREQVIMSENLASVGLLGAGVAHEINNPLDIMGYYIENLKFSGVTEDQMNKLISIEEEVESISSIVGNLISFSDKDLIDTEYFCIYGLTSNLVELLNYKAEEFNINIELETSDNSHKVAANRGEIKQVLLNLVRNSFDAMPKGGRISISIKNIENMVRLRLSDNGPGIPKDELKNIFIPFYSTKDSSGNNMGLGLSLSYSIVQKNGGSLEIVNGKSEGCIATLMLPLITFA